MRQQDLAVASGYWPLIRYSPAMRAIGENPFRLDSPRPTVPFEAYAQNEIRYTSLARTNPKDAADIMAQAQAGATAKYQQYEDLAVSHAAQADAVAAPPEARDDAKVSATPIDGA
jgi:pyruvate-ferredoxin/flavodoxin oxidoreductase